MTRWPRPGSRSGGAGSALTLFAALQLLFGLRVLRRFRTGRAGDGVGAAAAPAAAAAASVSVVVPVLDEERRLGPCLDGLSRQGEAVGEILVVDGGSRDGTRALVERHARRDSRIKFLDAAPVPPRWNGKAWGLQVGYRAAAASARWLATVDADVRPAPGLVAALVSRAERRRLAVFSVATRQVLGGPGEGLLHPAFLTTLVYRFGPPGRATRLVSGVQANGQCMLFERTALARVGGFASARDSRCEDVTIARRLARAGYPVGFFEAGHLAPVRMYEGWRAVWQNWPRSLPLRDRYVRRRAIWGLAEATLVQALPLPLLVAAWPGSRRPSPLWLVNAALVAVRLGVLVGVARAYARPPWTYWLSPLADLPAVAAIWLSAFSRRHVWRGRPLVDGGFA